MLCDLMLEEFCCDVSLGISRDARALHLLKQAEKLKFTSKREIHHKNEVYVT